jgi:hypothetical protein
MSKAAQLAALIGSGQAQGNKNLIINGAMQVAQRGTLTGQGGSANEYAAVDRYQLVLSGAKTPRITSSQQSTTVGEFSSQLKLDCTTLQSSVSAADLFAVRQRIEGQNLQHLQYGTSSAKTLSATFTITSPKSGIHCLQLHNRDANYSYVREFTVDTANTAQRISVTFPGYTASALDNDTESSLELAWPLLAGSNWQGSKNGWNSGNYFATSNQQNLLDNTSNDFLITGVQLEVGEVATPFEHETYAATLQKCKRYFNDVIPSGGIMYCYHFAGNATANRRQHIIYSVPMRATPTAVFTGGAHGGYASGKPALENASSEQSSIDMNLAGSSDSNYSWLLTMTLSAEL